MIILLLYIIGVVAFVTAMVVGISSGSFVGFIISIAGGSSSAVILFALARILENQENILSKLQYQEEVERKSRNQEKKVCTKCNYKYDNDYNSCPHCGHRD